MPLLKDTKRSTWAVSVLFPLVVKCASAVLVVAFTATKVQAEITPHGRPANLSVLPGVAIGLGGSVASDYAQTDGFIEAKTSQTLLFTVGVQNHASTSDSIAVNGDVDLEGSGVNWGVYYQLPDTDRLHLAVSIRSLSSDTQDDSLIVSGASRVDFERSRRAVEISLLTEYKAWSKVNLMPYFAANLKRSDDRETLATTGGRNLSTQQNVPYTVSVSAGLLYRYRLLSLFVEGTLGNEEATPVAVHAGLRLGFFNRPNTP